MVTFHQEGYAAFEMYVERQGGTIMGTMMHFDVVCEPDNRTIDFTVTQKPHVCWYELVAQVDPTCTERGYYDGACPVCGDTYREYIDPYGHQGEWELVVEPGYNREGLLEMVCELCGEVLQETLPAGGTGTHHCSFDLQMIDRELCTDEGMVIYYCACGNSMKGETVPGKSHAFGRIKIIKEPTETESGLCIRYCIDCSYSREDVLPAGTGGTYLPATPFDGPTVDVLTDPTLLSIVEQTPAGGTLIFPMDAGTGLHMDDFFVSAMANADITLVLDYGNITVTFDNASINAIADAMTGDDAIIVLEVMEAAALNDPQKAALQNLEIPLLFSIRVLSGGQEICYFGNGTVTFEIPLAPDADTAEAYTVYHVQENGQLDPLPITQEGGALICATNHFSIYALTLPKEEPAPAPEPTVPAESEPTEPQPSEPAPTQSQPSPTESKPLPTEPVKIPEEPATPANWILPAAIGGVAVLGIAILVVYLIKRKKA